MKLQISTIVVQHYFQENVHTSPSIKQDGKLEEDCTLKRVNPDEL
jgi:hypothetical protein